VITSNAGSATKPEPVGLRSNSTTQTEMVWTGGAAIHAPRNQRENPFATERPAVQCDTQNDHRIRLPATTSNKHTHTKNPPFPLTQPHADARQRCAQREKHIYTSEIKTDSHTLYVTTYD
jgi:hypothetical protein